MGLFSFLRKKQAVELSLDAVPRYIESAIERLCEEQDFLGFKRFIADQEQEIRKKLDLLEEGELLNKRVPERALHLLDGNRKAFIRRTERLLKSLTPLGHIEELPAFLASFEQEIASFGEDTKRNYLVIKEFLEDELIGVVRAIHEIETRTRALHKRVSESLSAIADIKEILHALHAEEQAKQQAREVEHERKKELARIAREEQEIIGKIGMLRKSSAFEDRERRLAKEQDILMRERSIASELHAFIAELERPLKKYKHGILDESLIDAYLKDAREAILRDAEHKILPILEKLKSELPRLGIDEKRQGRIASLIARMAKETLAKAREDLVALEAALGEVRETLAKDTIHHELSRHEAALESLRKKKGMHTKGSHASVQALPMGRLDQLLRVLGATLAEESARRKPRGKKQTK